VKTSLFKKLFASGVASFALSVTLFYFESNHSFKVRKNYYLQWAKQISHQVKKATEYASQRNEKNPLLSAIQELSTGADDQLIQISMIRQIKGALPTESYEFEADQGIFRLDEIIESDQNQGVRILIQTPYRGFLGTQNRMTHDVALIMAFLLFFNLFFFPLHFITSQTDSLDQDSKHSSEPSSHLLTQQLIKWIGNTQALLFSMGEHLKESTKGMSQLIANTVEFQAHLLKLRDQTSQAIEWTHALKMEIKTQELTKKIDLSRLHQLETTLEQSQNTLEKVQLQYRDTFKHTDQINASISLMALDLGEEAQMIEDLGQEMKGGTRS